MHLKLAVMPWGCSSCSSNPWFFARNAWLKLKQPRILSPENGQKATTTLRQGELEVRFAPFSKLTKVTLPKSVSNTYIQGLFSLSSGFSFWSFGQISGRTFERMARLLRISCIVSFLRISPFTQIVVSCVCSRSNGLRVKVSKSPGLFEWLPCPQTLGSESGGLLQVLLRFLFSHGLSHSDGPSPLCRKVYSSSNFVLLVVQSFLSFLLLS